MKFGAKTGGSYLLNQRGAGLKGKKRATQRVMGPFFEKKRNGQRKRRNKGMYEFEKR